MFGFKVLGLSLLLLQVLPRGLRSGPFFLVLPRCLPRSLRFCSGHLGVHPQIAVGVFGYTGILTLATPGKKQCCPRVSFLGWSVLSFLIPKEIHRSQKSKDPEILISEIPGGANDVCSTNGAGFLEMFVGRPPSHFLVVFPPLEVQGWISSPKNP